MKTYDVVVIGTGTAGQTAALDISNHGYKTAVVEQSHEAGGVCALHGCQSKKYFYEAAEVVARCHHLLGKGIKKAPGASWRDVLNQKNRFTAEIPKNTIKNLKSNGIEFYKGKAVFTGQSTIAAGDQEIQGRFIIIATGAEPVDLPVKGGEHIITSNDFLALDCLPDRIAFVGGGFISFEFAHFAARLGSRPGHIHILEANEHVLGPFDSDMVKQLTIASNAEGIAVHTGVEISEILKTTRHVQVVSQSNGAIEVDLVVNGAGRRPCIGALNLEAGGIQYSKDGIDVDSAMKTSNPNVFAVGDCASSVQLARVADMEAKTAAHSILNHLDGRKFRPMDYRIVPAVLFTYPQLGMVGKTEKQIQKEGIPYLKSADTELSWPTYRRVGMQHAAYKILVDKNEQILGAHFLSDNTSGLVNTFAQAMRSGASIREMYENHILAPYPSRESDILYMVSRFVQ